MTCPSLTIVTPCLNPGWRLDRCLASVANQTYPVEHIVIDGGSVDGTVELLKSRKVIFVSEPDRGQTHAINKGFMIAHGDFVSWLNADDTLATTAAESVAAAVRDRPDVGWVYGDCLLAVEGHEPVTMPRQRRLSPSSFDLGNVIPQPGLFISRRALDRVGMLDESLDLAMDFDILIRLLDAGIESLFIRRPLATFELHPNSKTGSRLPGEFLREESVVLAKSGRVRQASFAYGRALALGVANDHDLLTRLDPSAVAAGRRVESAVSSIRRLDPRGIRYLLGPTLWCYPETYRRFRTAGRFLLFELRRRYTTSRRPG